MKKVTGPKVRLVDPTGVALAGVPPELTVTLENVAVACREGLMAVAVEASLATAMAITGNEAARWCGGWNARDPERGFERGGTTPTSVVMASFGVFTAGRPAVSGRDRTDVRRGRHEKFRSGC